VYFAFPLPLKRNSYCFSSRICFIFSLRVSSLLYCDNTKNRFDTTATRMCTLQLQTFCTFCPTKKLYFTFLLLYSICMLFLKMGFSLSRIKHWEFYTGTSFVGLRVVIDPFRYPCDPIPRTLCPPKFCLSHDNANGRGQT
jgi:hypothetical protein